MSITTSVPVPEAFGVDFAKISSMASTDLDKLPFGAIKLSRDGIILSYNATESKLTGRDPQKVLGKDFFREVAPCTNVKEFAGRYREGVAKGELRETFRYRFDFKMAPLDVTVTLFYDKRSDAGWVFVRSLG